MKRALFILMCLVTQAYAGELIMDKVTVNGTLSASNTTITAAQVGAVGIVVVEYTATNITGPVVAWGYNSAGETDVPASVTNAISIAAGTGHSLAALSNGTVVVWGGLGRPTITNVPISATNVIAVSAGRDYSLALRSNGTVIGWGYRTNSGQINIPTSVTNAIAISAGRDHALALNYNGTVIGWGHNNYGQTNIPASVTNVISIAAGEDFSLALLSNGTVIGWGYGNYGLTNIPASVTNVIAIAAGGYNALAIISNGTVIVWGANENGETNVPASVINAIAIDASDIHCLALLSNSTIIGWGNDFYGESTTPASVINPTAISAGGGHSLAILQHVVTPRYSTQADYQNVLTNTISKNSSFTSLVGLTSKTYPSTTNLVVDAMLQNEVIVTLTNDTTVMMPTNAIDGRTIKWRFFASGGNRTIEWPTNIFRIPTSSTMTNLIVVSNNTYSVFVTEYAEPTTNWLMQAYIWGYGL